MNKEYFNEKTILSLTKYIQAQTKEEKNKIINTELYDFLYKNAKGIVFQTTKKLDPDNIQDLIIFAVEKVLPKITLDKVCASQNLLWISLLNKQYSIFRSESKTIQSTEYVSDMTEYDEFTDSTYTNDFEIESEKMENRKLIINKLDSMIKEQQIANKSKSLFLQLIVFYCLENDFDVSNFREYMLKEMNYNRESFWNLCSKLNIKSKVFNEKISKKYYK